jgi:hypothetical protein
MGFRVIVTPQTTPYASSISADAGNVISRLLGPVHLNDTWLGDVFARDITLMKSLSIPGTLRRTSTEE